MLSSIYCLTYPNKLGDQTLSILVSWLAFSQCGFWYWLATVGWAEFSMCQRNLISEVMFSKTCILWMWPHSKLIFQENQQSQRWDSSIFLKMSIFEDFCLSFLHLGKKMTITSSRKQAPPVRYLGLVRRNTSDSPSNV